MQSDASLVGYHRDFCSSRDPDRSHGPAMRTKPVMASAKLEQVALSAATRCRPDASAALKPYQGRPQDQRNRSRYQADQESEQAAIQTLGGAFPDHANLAEESGANARQSAHRWIIDPLDGTTNFAHGFPQFCVSIAYELADGSNLPRRRRSTARYWPPPFPTTSGKRRKFYLSFWEPS